MRRSGATCTAPSTMTPCGSSTGGKSALPHPDGNGSVSLNIRPELLDEVFHEALSHLDRNAEQHHISVELEDDLLMADMDARLIVQVVINLSTTPSSTPCRFPHLLVRCPGRSFCARSRSPMTVQVLRTAPSRKYLICFIPRTTPAEMAGGGWAWGCPCAGPSSPLTAVRYQSGSSATGQYFVSP